MIFNLKRLGASGLPVIDFDGDMLSAFSGDEWEAAFLESGTIQFNSNPGDCDIFLVADGNAGGAYQYIVQGGVYYYGAPGGAGGNYLLARATLQAGVDYTLTVGATTTLSGGDVSLSTESGIAGKSGGASGAVFGTKPGGSFSGGTGYIVRQPAKGTNGVFAYNDSEDRTIIPEFAGKRFSAGGGGGDAFISALGLYTTAENAGGETDGGDGARRYRESENVATAGGAHTGSGGGGAYFGYYQGGDITSPSKAGGSGVCLIRKHRGA